MDRSTAAVSLLGLPPALALCLGMVRLPVGCYTIGPRRGGRFRAVSRGRRACAAPALGGRRGLRHKRKSSQSATISRRNALGGAPGIAPKPLQSATVSPCPVATPPRIASPGLAPARGARPADAGQGDAPGPADAAALQLAGGQHRVDARQAAAEQPRRVLGG